MFKYDTNLIKDPNKVAAVAIHLNSVHAQLCADDHKTKSDVREELKIKNLTEDNLRELINQCKQTNNWNLLNNSIESIFSNRLNLSTSFLKNDFSENISINNEFSSTASATPKSNKNSSL
jgi:hypothetical protein